MYRLRADVAITPLPRTVVRGIGACPDDALPDPRHPSLGWRAWRSGPAAPPTIDWDAIRVAAEAFGLTPEDLKGRAQPQRIVRARHAYVMVGRQLLNESFPRIARAIGRDHTTAISSMRRGEAIFERDKKFQSQIAEIKAALGG